MTRPTCPMSCQPWPAEMDSPLEGDGFEPSVPHKKQPFLAAPVRSRNSPSATKTGSFVPRTDGSNPSPSSSEPGAPVGLMSLTGRYAMAEPVLMKGSNDPAVRDLQEALKVLGFDPGPVDGVFGAQTESAVKNFQQAREIPADG